MRRRFLPIAVSVLSAALTLGACSNSDDGGAGGGSGSQPIRIGASPTPHAEILQFVQDELATEAGLKLDIVEYTDYIQPNVALSEGDLDANYFQHLPYYEVQVAERDYDFGHFPGIHIEPYAAYSDSVDDVADLPDGARVGITNDPSNQARALDLLVEADLITLDDTGEEDPTILDVADNPRNLEFVETDPEQLPRSLQDFDLAIINGNYALEGGLNPAADSLLIESGENNPYANFVAVRAEDVDDPRLVKLNELLHSAEVRTFITTRWPKGEVLPAF
ncbi:ABC transporter [Parafrankia colletiae]|uniref:Lipoprotein n=1 Tax=Parafrankia colletiae TaxID=573497 RepID=A0A1S1R2Z0_9ACTN|nr:MetQ/NlpA family ABC transporter substrate-binding protein [Parafrankia colletiae]MCK9900247.1 MetQ/NlpA family ABC transporter substrate-binding protein [Frankia sp. Cpl3]OHV40287.1 ABC transporter [Parafrankia colletiae]